MQSKVYIQGSLLRIGGQNRETYNHCNNKMKLVKLPPFDTGTLVISGFGNSTYQVAKFSLKLMPPTRSKKAKARRSREADIMSDIENMDVMLASGEYNQIERDIDQMTGFSNMLNRDDIEEGHSMRGNSSQDNEIRNMPEYRNIPGLTRDLDMLSGEINLGISQEKK